MPHRISLTVAEADIDELGHASNLSFLRWVIEAAVAHSLALGLGPEEYRRRGQSFVVRRHTIDYLRSVYAGDEILVETRVVSMRTASSERETLVLDAKSGARVAHARSLWAFVDLAAGRPARIPADVSARFAIEPSVLQAPS
jgi:acyl-CoA thioester hydrolase